MKKKEQKIALNLGCGIGLFAGYVNVDKFYKYEDLVEGAKTKQGEYRDAVIEKGAEYIQADILKLPFPDNYADSAELHQVIEHFAMKEVEPAVKEIYRVLKPGGTLLLTTPNFTNLALEWLGLAFKAFDINKYIYLGEEIYGNQAAEGEFHRCPMTPQFLQFALGQAGFADGIIEVAGRNALIPTDKKKYGILVRQGGEGKVFRSETIIVSAKK